MSFKSALVFCLMVGCVSAGTAWAQPPATQRSVASSPQDDEALQEIVVTATRHEQTVHEIPFSVSAVTGEVMAEQGIKTASDLDQLVAGLYISPSNGGGTAGQLTQPQVTIRGISAEGAGAATTGVYIDDIPLQQRNTLGVEPGGTVFPHLFDLDRVEVLRGPQGTLYGGSSEGGTVRFITPQPSFTSYTANVLVEGSQTQYGDPNAEGGLTLGGPLIEDTLAGRMSVWYRHEGGYIDHVSQYTGDVLPGGDNTNSADHRSLTAALAWKAGDNLTVTAKYFYFSNSYRDSDEYWGSIPQYQTYLGPGTPGTLYTYCPCNFGPYKSGQNSNVGENFYRSDSQLSPLLSPNSNSLSLPSLTLDYQLAAVDVKLISAYADTINDAVPNYSYVDPASRSVTPLEAPYNSLPNNGPYIATLPLYQSVFGQHGHNTDLTEELRATSTDANSRVSWVAGVFYDLTNMSSSGTIDANTGDLAVASLIGLPSSAGTPLASLNGVGFVNPQSLREIQTAAYGQASLRITDHLRLSVGERVTRDKFSYAQEEGGALFGFAQGVLAPVASGSVTQTPVTPSFGVQYVVDPDLNFYANASKGFRAGGVNVAIPSSCAASLAAVGYSSAPETYNSDSLWSYELGSKWITWDGKASINAAAYYVDWSGVQTPIPLTCGETFLANAAKAVSQGGNLEAAVKLFSGFTLTLNGAYTDAHYTKSVSSDGVLLIGSGNKLPYVPEWTGNLSAQYRWTLANRPAFVRADYSYQGRFAQTTGPGTEEYLPDAYRLPGYKTANARAGMFFGKLEVDAFVMNLTNSQDLFSLTDFASGPGRVGCNNASCTSYAEYTQGSILSTYRPRTFGLDVQFKY